MPYPCTDDPNEILEYVAAAKTNAQKFNTFVNGSSTQTVQLGTGDPTPVLRKFIADAQSVVATAANEAAETVLDDIADMKLNKADKYVPAEPGNLAKLSSDGNLRDAGHAAEDFVPLLAYANGEAVELAWQNRMAFARYEDWLDEGADRHSRDMDRIVYAGNCAMQVRQAIRDVIDAFDESAAQHRLQIRLFDGTNPTSSSKPVLFVVAGQSNAVGTGQFKPFAAARDCGQFWSWADSSNTLKPIADPTGEYLIYGSCWPDFARAFFSLTGRKVLLLNLSSGGSAVTDGGYDTANTWADNAYGTLRTTRQEIWSAFSEAAPASGYDVGGILWSQGCAEIWRMRVGRVTIQDYINGSLDVFDWLRTLVGVEDCPVFIGKTGYYQQAFSDETVRVANEAIQNAQMGFLDEENVYAGFGMAPDFALPPNYGWDEYMSDVVHYSRLGYRIMGKSFARSVATVLQI